MLNYRLITFENSYGEQINFSTSECFLRGMNGSGFEYDNAISSTGYKHINTTSFTSFVHTPITGTLTLTRDDNARIFSDVGRIATILNRDMLYNRLNPLGTTRMSKLIIGLPNGVTKFTYVLTNRFSFGEIGDDTSIQQLRIGVTFDRLTALWYNLEPIATRFIVDPVSEHLKHPMSHPKIHRTILYDGATMQTTGGNDLSTIVIVINGAMKEFALTFDGGGSNIQRIFFQEELFANQSITINNFNKTVKREDGTDAFNQFDYALGDFPFFDLLPDTNYTVTLDTIHSLVGSIEVMVYTGWVSL